MKKSRLSTIKQNKLIEYFVAGVTARCAADLVGVNGKTGGYYFHRLRKIIFLFADKKNHINGIESFWNQAKRHMRKFNGVPKDHFQLFLKEGEWRFNNPKPKAQLKQLKQWVK